MTTDICLARNQYTYILYTMFARGGEARAIRKPRNTRNFLRNNNLSIHRMSHARRHALGQALTPSPSDRKYVRTIKCTPLMGLHGDACR